MSKLFAFEDLDEGVVAGELEAAPEVGEVADVQVDVEQDAGDIVEQADAIDEGVEAGDQMEQVEALVEQAAETGEGLDPVAAEALRIAVESICHRVGANPKSFYALYATENFQSASSRKANTRFALEGVQEFLKDLWKKIKAALQNLYAKAQAFWDKHISSLGRAKKALESMKSKVSASSGKLESKAYIEEAPAGLADALGGGELSASSFDAIIKAHSGLLDSAETVVEATKGFNDAAAAKIEDPAAVVAALSLLTKASGLKATGLIGGLSIEYKFDVDTEAGTANLEVERENADKGEKGGVSLADKNAVKGLLETTLKLINDNIKAKEKTAKCQEAFNKFSMAIEKAINASVEGKDSAERAKELRKAMKVVYKVNAKAPGVQNECLALNVRLVKAVLAYAALCLKNYK